MNQSRGEAGNPSSGNYDRELEKEQEFIFRTYYARLCYYASKILAGREGAEDIVQEVFVKVFNQRRIYPDEVARKNYLYLSVRNACLNFIRHHKVEQKYLAAQPADEAEEAQGLHKIIDAEVMAELNKAIASLPEGCRKVFSLGYLEGFSNQQIAEQLQVSVNTVKTQKARALQLLRIRLSDRLWIFLLLLITH